MPQVIQIQRRATIPAERSRVWDVVADPERAADWFSLADRVDVLAGDGRGQKRLQHARHNGRRSEIEQEVVEFDVPRLIAWKHTAERVDGKTAPAHAASTVFRIELATHDDGTLVTLTSQQTPTGLVGLLVLRVLNSHDVGRRMDESLVRLARAVD